MINKFGLAFLTMFGIGNFKYAPGTCCFIYHMSNFLLLWIKNLIFIITKYFSIFFN